MRTVTNDVIDVLEAGGLTVGDATGAGLTAPYVVVYPLGDLRDGTLGAPWSDVRSGMQATCVGSTRLQAEWLHDRVVTLLTAHVGDWWVEVAPSGAVAREDATGAPSQFLAFARFEIHSKD